MHSAATLPSWPPSGPVPAGPRLVSYRDARRIFPWPSNQASISELLEESRRTTARTINRILTATYWEIGRRIVEFEQGGEARAEYGTELLKRLSADLTARFRRGFSRVNLQQMRLFALGREICQTPSDKFEARVRLPEGLLESAKVESPMPRARSPMVQTPSAQFAERLFAAFPLAWSHYVRLMAVDKRM